MTEEVIPNLFNFCLTSYSVFLEMPIYLIALSNNLLSNLQNTFGKTVIKQGIDEKNSDYFKYD